MKIIAKQGSELEKLLKQMNERLLREQDEAKDMIQEYCGSRPDSIGYVWAFGFTAEWFYTLIGFENKEFVPEKLIPNNDDKKHLCWKINKRKMLEVRNDKILKQASIKIFIYHSCFACR